MWTNTKIKEILIRLTLILGVVLVPLTSVGKQVFAQSNMPPIWLVRSIYTEEYGLNQPKGLAYSPIANMFFVMDGSANIALISNGEDNAGIKVVSGVQGEALNVAFDKKTGSLFSFSQGRSELVKIKSDGTGLPDASAAPSRSSLGALGIKNAQGLAFDPENGRLFILDADSSQIVSVASHPTLGFDANEAVRSNKVQKISLKKLGTLKGLAYNPGNGHLYVSEPAQKKLYELTQDGDIVSTFDLASLGINNPSAMTFAPSVDNTDDPNIYDLFILDTTASGQIVELSLQEPAALPPGTTLLPATLVNIIDTSSWNPPAPDPAGIDYFPLTDRLIISDSEVNEMPIFEGKNVFLSTRSGNLTGTCTTFPFTGSASNPSTGEPTGVAVNPNNNHIFIAADFQDRLFEISLGADGQYCTADDTVTNTSLGTTYGVTDAEDVAYGNNTVFIAGGTDAEVFVIPLGPNGVVGGGDDGPMTHWDTAALGFSDTEGIGFNHDAGTLFIVSTKRTDKYLGEFSTSGTLLRAYDLSFMPNVGNIRSDVTYAPGSQNPSVKSIYIASRGVDNNSDPNENDGQVWEINIGGSPGPTNTPTKTNTPGPSPTRTNTPTLSDLIFTDGFESGNFSAWSSNNNDGGDLSVSAAAALVETRGMQAHIDDNNPIFITDETPNAEPRYRARFYFDPNSIGMAGGDNHFVFQGYSGTPAVLRVQFRFSSGNYQLRASLQSDGSGWTNTPWFTISDAPHFIELDWRAATGAGANNGGLTLWIDNTQQANLSNIDNDTRWIDRVQLGAVTGIDTGTRGSYFFDAFESRRQAFIGPAAGSPPPTATNTPSSGPSPTFTNTPATTATKTPTPTNTPDSSDLIFANGFESGNLAGWTSNSNDAGDLSASAASALVGSQGMQAVIDDNNTIYVTDDSPNAESRYRARFYFDPNSITMLSGEAHFIFKGFLGTSTSAEAYRVEFRQSSGAYQLRAALMLDGGTTWVNTNWFTIIDAPHFVEIDWRASSGAGANNGGLTLWIDGVQQANLTGADNDTWRVDRARLGALSGIDNGTRGTYYFDAFESRRQTYIGP